MTPEQAWTEPRALHALIAGKPLPEVLAWLNARTDFRFTALGRLVDGTLHDLANFDRVGMPSRLPPTKVAGSYFEFVLAGSEFVVENSLRDERLADSQYRKLIRAFYGVPVALPQATAIGVLYHYDVLPRKFPPAQADLLRLAADWLAPTLPTTP